MTSASPTSRTPRTSSRWLWALLCAALLAMAGCGQSGPLFLPSGTAMAPGAGDTGDDAAG